MSNLYDVLGIHHEAEDDAIAKAYRRQSMAFNPQCNPNHPDPKALEKQFKHVSQAYVVLSNPKARGIYDMYGEEGVRHGGTGNQWVPGGIDLDAIDPYEVFRCFFGVDNPFQVIGEISGLRNNQHNFFSTSAVIPKTLVKVPPIEVSLSVSLEDVFYGAMRRATWQSHHVRQGQEIITEESFDLRVPKGAHAGDRFVVDGKGNWKEGFARGDVVVVLELLPHDRFRREEDDLVVVMPITLCEALCGVTLTVKTMEGVDITVLIDEIVHPKYRRRVAGQGLPRNEDLSNPRGDLIVECDTKFPGFLTLEQKSELRRILDVK
ncbi:putative DnaJ [Trypanosoma cruzi]|uniref:Heat shock protein-like protein, putative n=2 Tax=Trypanosoma cruzi TaxID=5693 RepID=Q4D4G9_TRYCC|nr:heat shock protein-like protein, putative [Trypanosoma cruzi]EAN87418.1 heat shock protein-like protein, putative [Trypanosoma cruzi]PWV18795.1 putative DnaJ [Trypanosoma cruzi]|eukprot:XP_809269.1 heat shock protein-like protein [Trypanosoma cruzi strain CL Brener]